MIEAFTAEGATAALQKLLIVITFRALPFFIYTVFRPSWPKTKRFGLVATYVATLSCMAEDGQRIILLCVPGLAYFAIVTLVVHALSKRVDEVRGGDTLLIYAVLWVAFQLIPATLLRQIALETVLFTGWELVMKAYSYVLSGGARTLNTRQCLFFFLVDPNIVLSERARKPSDMPARIMLPRMALGICAVYVAFVVGEAASQTIDGWSFEATGLATIPALLCSGTARLLVAYAKHSGVASIQLCLMAFIGLQVQERYRYPLFARTPLEFWSRWNTYVGHWAKRYLYQPMALRLARQARTKGDVNSVNSTSRGRAWAVIATFALMGAQHDAYVLLESHELSVRATVFFTINALLLLASVVATGVEGRRLAERGVSIFTRPFGMLQRAALIIVFLASAGVA